MEVKQDSTNMLKMKKMMESWTKKVDKEDPDKESSKPKVVGNPPDYGKNLTVENERVDIVVEKVENNVLKSVQESRKEDKLKKTIESKISSTHRLFSKSPDVMKQL